MKRVIITGFGAFHTHSENPSEKLLSEMALLKDEEIDYELVLLPVVFSAIEKEIPKIIESITDESAIIFCGLAASRTVITPEKIALNWLYSPKRMDNDGRSFDVGEELVEGAPLALMSQFPVEELVKSFQDNQLEAQLSFSAGTYVCNQTFYYGLYELQKKGKSTPCTFLHMPENVDVSKLALELHRFLMTL